MERLLLAGGIVVVVAIVALLLERRRPEPPTQPRWATPSQLDRQDFARPEAPWLVAVFTSATCNSCAGVLAKAQVLSSAEVVVQEVEAKVSADVHRRYAVEAVPIIVVADHEGVVRASFVGPATATDLWAAVAEARAPGTSPEPDLGQANDMLGS
ncbi:MAG TPA: thioredoxin domain-containing protein [Acidimicrobiales bacterium]|nr:thioredoxin domain-containing protein [Acidimicrobiales bacterium]